LDETFERGTRDALLTAEPCKRKTSLAAGAFPLDGQLVGLGATELQGLGGLADSQEGRQFIEHETRSCVVHHNACIVTTHVIVLSSTTCSIGEDAVVRGGAK